jgi:hypothetical protein
MHMRMQPIYIYTYAYLIYARMRMPHNYMK